MENSMENSIGTNAPRLWCLHSWEPWHFLFTYEARVCGLWDIITTPGLDFLERPTRPDQPVEVHTLSTGNPDEDRLSRDIQTFRNKQHWYITRRAHYKAQGEEHALLKLFVQRTVSSAIFASCCPAEADIRHWYNNIVAHVGDWKKESGISPSSIAQTCHR
ncbi:hypothetical protein CONLIGDRAFT_411743 [Coniochaeta ligniaria NRRL 30616]|uniref:Uncharacterized protein n=1 Tax=Coniochaeta ligniaria NRRL 30616 TaxID=1408157 RepID=A0A1J7IP31_9PEZI|nr:hypothetical protein CONLIGDRAFT_411743 [Coniochaeta ligniaria NRRL 30616]